MPRTAEDVFHYEPWEGDLMDRHVTASTLQNYLDGNDDVRVLNINAPWGTGKTWFIKRWHDEMRKTRPAIYFNAWKNDHINDPFIAVVSAVSEQAKEQMNTSATITEAVKNLGEKAASAFVAAAPGMINTIIKHKLGIDVDKIFGDADEDAIGELSEKAVEALIRSNKTALEEVENFRKELGRLAAQLSIEVAEQAKAEEGPLYIFIDELDRCRPTYSIELLERVKHFFDVDNCKFVIASDTAQLRHSISAVYGAGFDSQRYLRRFFDVEFELVNDNVEQWVINELEGLDERCVRLGVLKKRIPSGKSLSLGSVLETNLTDLVSENEDIAEQHIMAMAIIRYFSLDMRTFKQCMDRVRFVASNIGDDLHFFWALYLVVLKKIDSNEYRFFKAGNQFSENALKVDTRPTSLNMGKNRYDVLELAKEYRDGISDRKVLKARFRSTNNDSEAQVLESIMNSADSLAKYYQLVELSHSLGG